MGVANSRAPPAEEFTLLDALSRAPAAAALVVAALGEADRKALRLAHSQLRDAAGEATTELAWWPEATARPPSQERGPRLEALKICPNSAALSARGAGPLAQ
jgi:hypothetical protein